MHGELELTFAERAVDGNEGGNGGARDVGGEEKPDDRTSKDPNRGVAKWKDSAFPTWNC